MKSVALEAGRLTIGVAAHGNVGVTIECLRSVFASVCGDFDLILVDDASPDDVITLFREARDYHPRTRAFSFSENKEYSHSVNCILTHAETELTLFVSNDVFITPAYVKALLEVMSDSTIGIARGVSNFVDGFLDSPIHNVPITDDVSSLDDVAALAEKIYGGDLEWATPDPFLVGDAFVAKGDLVRRVGGFDTNLCGYFSDVDFGIRAAHSHYRKVVCGRAFAWHAQDANSAYLPDAEREKKILRRRARLATAWAVFRKKWGLTDLPEDWSPTMLRAIPYQRLGERPFDESADVALRQDYSEFRCL